MQSNLLSNPLYRWNTFSVHVDTLFFFRDAGNLIHFFMNGRLSYVFSGMQAIHLSASPFLSISQGADGGKCFFGS